MSPVRGIGVSGVRTPPCWSSAAAMVRTVGYWNSSRMLNSASRVARMRLIRRVARSEWPPSSKKPSSMPTLSRPSTSANSTQRISSRAVRGARAVLPEV